MSREARDFVYPDPNSHQLLIITHFIDYDQLTVVELPNYRNVSALTMYETEYDLGRYLWKRGYELVGPSSWTGRRIRVRPDVRKLMERGMGFDDALGVLALLGSHQPFGLMV